MIRRLLLAAALASLAALPARAACTLPFTLLPNTLADATKVMADFNALVACQAAVLPVLDARDYGVVADGSTSDDVALAAALTACSTLGRTLVLPQGRILLTGAASVSLKNCNVVGQGVPNGDTVNRGTTILLTSTTVAPFVCGSSWSLRGISFYWPNQTTGTTIYPALVSDDGATQCNYVVLDSISVVNAYIGFKQTVPVSWGDWNIANSLIYAVKDGFSISNTGDSWRWINTHFSPAMWITLLGSGAYAPINAADQVNTLLHVTGDGTTNVTMFGQISAFAWRWGIKVDATGLLGASDLLLHLDGVGTFVDTTSGGTTSGTVFRGGGNASNIPVYSGAGVAGSGSATAIDLGANGEFIARGFELSAGRGSFIKTAGSGVFVSDLTANFGQAVDGTEYYGVQHTAGSGRIEVRNSDFYGQADSHTHGIYSHTGTNLLTIQNNTFLNLNDDLDIVTTSNGLTTITGNTGSGTVSAASVSLTGTTQVQWGGNSWDKGPVASVSSCGVGPTIAGATTGSVAVGGGGVVNTCKITLPFTPFGGFYQIGCTFISSVGSLTATQDSATPPSWTFGSASDLAGANVTFNCPGKQ